MPTHIKIAAVRSIENGHVFFNVYGPPDAEGKQAVREVIDCDLHAIKLDEHADHVLGTGLAALAQQRWTLKRGDERPDAAAVIRELHRKLVEGTWSPGRIAEPKTPSVLVEALAELSGIPTHAVEAEMSDQGAFARKLNADSYKKALAMLRSDPDIAKRMAEIEKKRAVEAERLAREAGKTVKERVNVGALFGPRSAAPAEAAQ